MQEDDILRELNYINRSLPQIQEKLNSISSAEAGQIADFLNTKWKTLYAEYLTSATWKKIRSKMLLMNEGFCELCNIQKAREVHHLSYKNTPFEKEEDLISLCSDCHRFQHLEKNPEIQNSCFFRPLMTVNTNLPPRLKNTHSKNSVKKISIF